MKKIEEFFKKMQDYKLVTDTPTPFIMTIGCSGERVWRCSGIYFIIIVFRILNTRPTSMSINNNNNKCLEQVLHSVVLSNPCAECGGVPSLPPPWPP